MELGDILIVGGGLVGQNLAERLSRDGYNVTLIERDPDKARDLSDTLDARIVQGDGTTTPVLREADIENVGLLVAATERDECNLVTGFLASHVFGTCLLYTSPSPRDRTRSRMPSSA